MTTQNKGYMVTRRVNGQFIGFYRGSTDLGRISNGNFEWEHFSVQATILTESQAHDIRDLFEDVFGESEQFKIIRV